MRLDRGTGPFAGVVKSLRSIGYELESHPRVRCYEVTCTLVAFCRRYTVLGSMDILISELSQLPATNQVVDADGMCECLPIYERVVLPFETKCHTSALAMLAGFGPVWCCRGCS